VAASETARQQVLIGAAKTNEQHVSEKHGGNQDVSFIPRVVGQARSDLSSRAEFIQLQQRRLLPHTQGAVSGHWNDQRTIINSMQKWTASENRSNRGIPEAN
jgi:hypothetical protein